MNAVDLESSDQLPHRWINELDLALGWDNKHRSRRLLQTVLLALRDWLPVDKAAELGARLPEVLRGVDYEHPWPAAISVKQRSKDDAVARIDHALKTDPILFTPEAAAITLAFLAKKISPGEIADVRHASPVDLRGF